MAMLEVKDLQVYYGMIQAIKGISFEVNQGEVIALIGANGAGKTTTLHTVTGLISPKSGQVLFEGKDITRLKQSQLKEVYGDIQMVFQNPVGSFDPRRTLGDGIGESLRNRGMKKADVEKRVAELLEQCGLEKEYAKRYPHEVSGGQCQRAAIARALAVEPKVLICDEATSALDVTIQKQVVEEMLLMREEYGTAMIVVTHNIGVVEKMADKVLVLKNGEVREYGKTAQVLTAPTDPYTKELMRSVLRLKRAGTGNGGR